MALPSSILQRGTRASQPLATAVAAGTYYSVSDEGDIIERSDGSAWSKLMSGTDPSAKNFVMNGGFIFALRQVPGTLTTYSQTAARGFNADRWAVTNENASIQYVRGDATTTPETGLSGPFYGTYSKITSTGKICISHCIEGSQCVALRSRTVRLQLRMKASSAKTMRVALLQLTSAGTIDTVPGYSGGAPSGTFISAFNADTNDPTFGTNLSKIAPVTVDNATSANTGLTCSVTTTWQRFGGTFLLPSDFKNLIVVVFTDSQFAAADSFSISEVGIYEGTRFNTWADMPQEQVYTAITRYYHKSFAVNTAPAQSAGLTCAIRGHVSVAGAVAAQPIGIRFPTVVRSTSGTFTAYNPSAANAFARNTSVGADATATAIANTGGLGADIQFTGVAGWLAGAAMAVHYTYDSEF